MQTTHKDSIPHTPTPPSASINTLLLGFVVLLLAAILGLLYIIASNGYFSSNQGSEVVRSKEKISEEMIAEQPSMQQIELIYEKERDLWMRDSQGEDTQITQTEGTVFAFDYAPGTDVVAYVIGDKLTNVKDYTYINPNAVYLTNINTNETKKIHAMNPTTRGGDGINLEYTLQLRDVGVSPDGEEVVITSSDSAWIYDVDKGSLDKLFTVPFDDPADPGVFAYSDPVFSPDKSNLILRKGYYEGSSYVFVDVVNRVKQDLPYANYVSGERVMGWLENQRLLLLKYGEEVSQAGEQASLNEVLLETPDKISRKLFSLEGFAVDIEKSGNRVYVLVTPSDSRVSVIYALDLKTLKKNELFRTKADQKGKLFYSNLQLSTDGKKLYVGAKRVQEGSSIVEDEIHVMNLDNPGQLDKIIGNARLE